MSVEPSLVSCLYVCTAFVFLNLAEEEARIRRIIRIDVEAVPTSEESITSDFRYASREPCTLILLLRNNASFKSRVDDGMMDEFLSTIQFPLRQ